MVGPAVLTRRCRWWKFARFHAVEIDPVALRQERPTLRIERRGIGAIATAAEIRWRDGHFAGPSAIASINIGSCAASVCGTPRQRESGEENNEVGFHSLQFNGIIVLFHQVRADWQNIPAPIFLIDLELRPAAFIIIFRRSAG